MIKFLFIEGLPFLFLLYFLYRMDKEKPEPKKRLATCFGLGMLGGIVGRLFTAIFAWLGIGDGYDSILFGDVVSMGVISAVYVSICYLILWKYSEKNPDFDEFFDGPVYSACIVFGYEFIGTLGEIGSEEWESLGWVSIFLVVALFATALCIVYYFSLAFFGKMEMTRKNKFKIWAIPFVIIWAYNVLVDWMNSSDVGHIVGIILLCVFGYYVYVKSKVVFQTLKTLDEANEPDNTVSESNQN